MKTTTSPVTSGYLCRHPLELPADISSEQATDIAGIRNHRRKLSRGTVLPRFYKNPQAQKSMVKT